MLHERHSPEILDQALLRRFLELLRARNVTSLLPGGRLRDDDELLAVAADAQRVRSEQIRHGILQVTHA